MSTQFGKSWQAFARGYKGYKTQTIPKRKSGKICWDCSAVEVHGVQMSKPDDLPIKSVYTSSQLCFGHLRWMLRPKDEPTWTFKPSITPVEQQISWDPLHAFCPRLTHFGTGLLHYWARCLSSNTFPGVGWTWWGSSECNKLMSWSRHSCWYFQTGMTGDVIHLGAPGELKRWNVPINI